MILAALLVLAALTAQAAPAAGADGLATRVRFVGGTPSGEDGGPPMVGQVRVTEVAPAALDGEEPTIVLLPGLGLPASLYLGTPDGRPGWAQELAAAGLRVFAVDPVNTGPSGIDPAAASAGLAVWSLATRRGNLWQRWGFGDEIGEPYADVRYPVEHIDRLYASFPVRAAGGRGRGREDGTANALVTLLEQTGPATLLAHSFSWRSAAAVLERRPELVDAMIVVEPTGCPSAAPVSARWSGKRFLAVYGDYIDSRGQTGRKDRCRAAVTRLAGAGHDATMLDLVERGIRGNTHLMMQDDNAGAIAAMLARWLLADR
jgi:pimeloyl-ACP methyl ester carboxylesterase